MLQTIGLLAGATMSLLGTSITNSTTSETIKLDSEPYYRLTPVEERWQGSFVSMYSNGSLSITEKSSDQISNKEATPSSKISPIENMSRASDPVKISLTSNQALSESVSLSAEAMSNSESLNAAELFNLVNSYRNQLNLPSFIEHPQVCQLAQERAPELHDEIFNGKGMHSGLRNRNLDYYVTENMIHQQTEVAALNWWLNSPIHRKALESTNNVYGCVACQGKSCAFLFTSYMARKQ